MGDIKQYKIYVTEALINRGKKERWWGREIMFIEIMQNFKLAKEKKGDRLKNFRKYLAGKKRTHV